MPFLPLEGNVQYSLHNNNFIYANKNDIYFYHLTGKNNIHYAIEE